MHKSNKIGYHYHIPALLRDGKIWTSGQQGIFIDALAMHCSKLMCFFYSPNSFEIDQMDYEVKSKNISLISLGCHEPVPIRLLKSKKALKTIKKHSIDLLVLRGPSPLLPRLANYFLKLMPVCLLIVGDYVSGVDSLPRPMLRKALIKIWAKWNKAGQVKAIKKSLVFVNNKHLHNEYKELAAEIHEITTTTLSQKDFYYREDTCRNETLKLLYTGRLSSSKGLYDVVQSVKILIDQGMNVKLDLVGLPEKNDPVLEKINEYIRENRMKKNILFHGYKKIGAELFRYYREADIFVLASRSSFEGFPRSLWEAMANGLPIISTDVSSIKEMGGDAVYAVPPREPSGLAAAITYLASNNKARIEMIKAGYEKVKNNTNEKSAAKIMECVREWAA